MRAIKAGRIVILLLTVAMNDPAPALDPSQASWRISSFNDGFFGSDNQFTNGTDTVRAVDGTSITDARNDYVALDFEWQY